MVMRLAAAFSERNAGAPASNQTPAREAAFVARFIDPGTVRTDWALRPAESGRVQPNWSDLLRGSQERVPQRMPLSRQNRVDWDSTPTFYEATSIAHGHLLHFKQTWFADGYSLGDLLYSLPLAPGQKKVISVIDWERREQSSRDELTSLEEGVQAQLSRDRDLGEVISGTLSEYSRGESSNSTKGFGIGKGSAGNGSYGGFSFGGVMGVSGGFGDSTSGAFLEGNREVSSSSLQTLRDRTVQSAAAVRSLRSTVVQTARQGETVRATTEVVANHNHCHTLTIQYFEVLRHMRAEHALEDVQECLFVPLPMMDFHREMVVRWRQPLEAYLQRPELAAGFDALRRVDTNWTEVDYPQARYADEHVTAIFGEMTLTILIPLPPFPEKPTPDPRQTVAELEAKTRQALLPTEGFLGSVLTVFSFGANHVTNAVADAAVKASTAGARALTDSLFAEVSPEERYARFHQDIMPGVAAGFVDKLELYAIVNDASTSMSKEVKLNGSDFTLVSGYEPGTPLLISVRGGITTPVRRSEISALVIKSSAPLPEGCRAIINSATLQYQTNLFRHGMVMDSRVNDDIDFPTVAYTGDPPATFQLPALFPAAWPQVPGMTPIRSGNGATLYTPLDEWEQRWPRREDSRLSAELIVHLNTNIEYYHHAIWWTMDPNRRYMLLDGFVAPGSNGRSVASVVDNKLIGIIGNSLILPVARGFHLDPQFSTKDNQTLLAHYKPQSPVPAANVALPTRGVFAEASVGECNACEEIDDTRFWRWEESPIDEPPVLDMSALLSRRAEPTNLTPTPLPAPIVSIQNAPAAPDPVGIEAALGALTTQSFADITGLAGTQANAAAAYAKAMDTALAFGKEASVLAQQANMNRNIGQTMRAIDKAESENKINSGNATQLRNTALKSLVGDTPTDATAASIADRLQVIDGAQERGGIDDATAQAFRSDVLSGLIPDGATLADQSEAVTDVLGQIPPENFRTLKFGDLELETVQLLGEKDAWPNLDSAQVRTRLKELLDSKGDKFDQGTLGLCSAAAFFHHVIQARPLEFYLFADALYRDGFARLGQLYVAPGRDVRNADFKALKKKFGAMPPQADWMLMSALRDSENWLLDFQGGENEDEAMETTAEELAGWYRKTGFYSKVIYSTERTPAAIDALERNNPSNQIALAVWAKLIPGYEQSTSGHAITVEGDLKVDIPNNRIEFDYWTWGKSEYRHTSRFLSNFASNFYLGAIVATRKPMGPRPDQQL